MLSLYPLFKKTSSFVKSHCASLWIKSDKNGIFDKRILIIGKLNILVMFPCIGLYNNLINNYIQVIKAYFCRQILKELTIDI